MNPETPEKTKMFLIDYIREHKDEKLTAENCTEVDFALFSLLCLFDMGHCFPKEDKEDTFYQVMSSFEDFHPEMKLGLLLPEDIPQAMKEAQLSFRYASLVIHDAYYLLDPDTVTQSAVFQIDLSDDVTCLVFGSTDDTILGWEENFRMAFDHEIPCLENCLSYVNSKLKKNRKYIFVGHSKGGMESLYCAIKAKIKDENLISVYGFDSPGYDEERAQELLSSERIGKIRFLCPQASVVGRLLHPLAEPEIVKSKALGVIQHDPATWYIQDDHFVRLPEFDKGSELLPMRINAVVNETKKEKAVSFIDALSSLLKCTGALTLTQCKESLAEIVKELHKADKKIKDDIFRFIEFMISGDILPHRMFEDFFNEEYLAEKKENTDGKE